MTVAGRDGAGRLGQESEELKTINSRNVEHILASYNAQQNSVILKWKVWVITVHS